MSTYWTHFCYPMNTSTHSEKDINSARTLFLVFCSSYIIGDIMGCLEDTYSLLFFIVVLSILYASRLYYRHIFLSALLALSLGYSVGQHAIVAQDARYATLQNITRNFTLKGDITGSVDTLLFRKERTSVYRVLIANFDTFANSENISQNTIPVLENNAVSLFVEIPSNLQIAPGDTIQFSGKIEKNIDE